MPDELIALIQGDELEPELEEQALDKALGDSKALSLVSRRLLQDRHELRTQLAKVRVAVKRAQAEQANAEERLEGLLQPPLQPAIVLRRYANGRLDVAAPGGRQIVAVHPDLSVATLRVGDEVWLDPGSGVAVSRADAGPALGRVASVAEVLADRVLVRTETDEEQVMLCELELAGTLENGDRVLVSGDVPCVLERLPGERSSVHLLREPPAVRFEDIGGLDELVEEVRRELDLHLFHPERVAAYRMKLMRGMTLVGPPGVGKTLFASAIARFLADAAPDTLFLNVKPGSLRGSLYGQTEARIQGLFSAARRAPGKVVIFFDELDSFGARGTNLGHDVDDRVIGTLLAEIDGVEDADGIFIVGATNRLDLIDDALIRHGRLGDRIVDIPRPGREATRAILAGLLSDVLPWHAAEAGATEIAERAAAVATSFLHAPEGGAGPILQLTFADGGERTVRARDLVSGALLASSVERAKKRAAARELEGGAGLQCEDVIEALDQALGAEARKLSDVHVARRALQVPRAGEITRVDLPIERQVGALTRLRAA